MADNFGLKIGVEGEREFKQALSEINQSFKVLGSEMNLVSSQFDKQDKSIQALTARNSVLNKEIDAQKDKISTLEAALKNASESFGENDRRTKNWAIQLNNAKAELNGMEKELEESATDAEDLRNELEKAGKSADDAGGRFGKLGGVLAGIGAAMGSVAVAAGAATVKLGKKIVQQFGELEQNLGGSEAVFGKYASSIQKTGEDAYKNMGVSQSQYLATANKMGALFQGSGIEQQKSLELTEKAMQRAADMASVMGIDMQVALDSVAGAAKGNFTMMDNLGVAMNATNIEAYALAKGLNFTWASATQAEKAEVAMQMFFENTQQYAGNFARESTETITGSIGLFQAALGSFTAGLGNANADMTNLTGNLVDAFQSVVKNIVPVIENIVAAMPTAMDAILSAIGDLLPTLLDTVTELFTQVLNTILTLLPELIPATVHAVMTIVGALIDNLPLLINQDYTLNSRINVVEKPYELIFTNAGSFIPRTIENVIEQDAPQEYYRNQFLANAMVNLNMIDTIGSGIKKMFLLQKQRYFPLPDYDLSQPDKVKVTIMGKIIDENYTKLLIKNTSLDLKTVMFLDKVQKKAFLSKDEYAYLKKQNLVEGRYPNIYVVSQVAEATREKAKYIKNRAFDKTYYKQLIIDFIRQYGSASRKEIDELVIDKLPDILNEKQKKKKISNIISEMANKDKVIKNIGNYSKSKWILN